MADFANPTGESLGLPERQALLEAAAALDFPLVEDAAYAALRYDGAALPSLLALDVAGCGGIDARARALLRHLLQDGGAGTAAGLGGRTAAGDPPPRPRQAGERSAQRRPQPDGDARGGGAGDAGGVAPIRAAYRARRDAMLAALAREMPAGAAWTRPEGGMFLWLTLPEGIDTAALLPRAIDEARVAFVPGRAFHADGGGANTLRLNFTLADPARIDDGIARLGALRAACPAWRTNARRCHSPRLRRVAREAAACWTAARRFQGG